MIPVGGYPILWHIMKYYASFKFKEFVLCLGYKSTVIKDFFLNYKAHTRDFTMHLGGQTPIAYQEEHSESDWRVTLADTGLTSLTGTRVKRIQKYVADEENFLLTYGDGVGSVNLDELVRFHKSHGKILTLTGVRPPSRFGEIASDASGRVIEFNEKPQATAGFISGGFFVCRREIFEYLPANENFMLEQTPMQRLARDGQMMLHEHEGFWQCMDTARDYQLLNGLYNSGKAPWVLW